MNKDFLAAALRNVVCVLFMYTFSISLTFYNRWVMKRFHFPLSVSVVHYIIVFAMTAVTRQIWVLRTGKKRPMLEWSVYLKRVGPTAVATALDIGLSNWSLMFITVSLYTMCKSTSIIFLLMFSLIFGLEKFHYSLCFIVFLISGGLFMFTYKSTQFDFTGFVLILVTISTILLGNFSLGKNFLELVFVNHSVRGKHHLDRFIEVQSRRNDVKVVDTNLFSFIPPHEFDCFDVMTASVIGGVRWTTTQILLQKESLGLTSPFDTIYHLQPLMTLATLPLAIGIEGEKLAVSAHLFRAPSNNVLVSSVFILMFGALQAFMLTVAEYLVLANTSSLTLSVAGIFKELWTILIAAKFAGDEMTFIKFCGLAVTLLGIALHVVHKITKGEKKYSEDKSKTDNEEKAVMLNNTSYDSDDR